MRLPLVLCLLAFPALAACGDRAGGRASRADSTSAGATSAQAAVPADSPQATGATSRPAAAADDRPVVLFLGNSLSAGLGVPEDSAFPALVQQKIDSAGLRFRVENAGVSGATSADGLQQVDWLLRQPVDVLVLELGGNDALRGLPASQLQENLRAIIRRFRARYPGLPVVLAGMEAPPNLGPAYTAAFRKVYPTLAREEHVSLIPFLLQDVGGIPELNQADRIHPNTAGHRIVARNVWRVLQPVLRQAARARATAGGAGEAPAGH